MEPVFSKKEIINELKKVKNVYLVNFNDAGNSFNIKHVNTLKDIVDESILDNIPSEIDIIAEIKQYSNGLILDILEL